MIQKSRLKRTVRNIIKNNNAQTNFFKKLKGLNFNLNVKKNKIDYTLYDELKKGKATQSTMNK